jgi:predicted RNase H-like nuclease (RuvC/YqgF family)
MARLQLANENLTNTVTQYTAAVDALESKLKEAYAGVAKQNEAITNLIAQRDEFVQKLNDSVKDRNRVVAKYNDLVKEINPANGKQVNDPK